MIKLKQLLREFQERKELYHATTRKAANGIINRGTDISLAGKHYGGAGRDQGSGFYFFTNKGDAIKQAEDFDGEVILVFNQKISVEDFDVDYEVEEKSCKKFLLKHLEFVKKHAEALGIKEVRPKNHFAGPVLILRVPDNPRAMRAMNLSVTGSMSSYYATIISIMFRTLERINKGLFLKFKKEFLFDAVAIKYIGEKPLFPIRVEDLKGNIILRL